MTQPSTLDTLAAHIAGALDRPLPATVGEKTKHHVLDTIAAMVDEVPVQAGRGRHQLRALLGRHAGGRRRRVDVCARYRADHRPVPLLTEA